LAKLSHLLDDIQIRHWISKRQAVAKSDGEGLTFTLSAAGTATWVLRYRYGGRRKELTLGNYPDMSLAAARKIAREKRVSIDQGGDPANEKQEAKSRARDAWLVRDLADDYKEKVLLPTELATDTIKHRIGDLEQVILPRLGAREVTKVTATDVVDMIARCGRTWNICKRILTCVSQVFDHACGLRLIPNNPCTGIKLKALLGPRPAVKKRIMLSEAELRRLLPDIHLIGEANALSFRILLATCVRTSELIKAEKMHLNFANHTWWVPDDSVKTRDGFLVPLVPEVENWFKRLIEISGESKYVLPTRRADARDKGGDRPVGRTTLLAAIHRAFDRGAIDVQAFTPHDTRSTAKGHLRNMGVSRDISEIALNHKLQGMEGIYDVRVEIPERREALTKWARFLIACETGAPIPSNVIELRTAA
jgi:integrase